MQSGIRFTDDTTTKESKRVVVLGNRRRVSLGAYVKGWKIALAAAPGSWFRETPRGWGGTREEALREFRDGLDDRINRHLPHFGKGRKWDPQWQIETLRAARNINHPRLVIHWLPEWLKTRFAHRIYDPAMD